jgi:hypothetical protein
MSSYKYDGRYFTDQNYKRIAEFDGTYLIDGNNYMRIAQIDGDFIVDAKDYRRVVEIRGEDIVDCSNYNTISKMNDIRNMIDGPGGKSLVAFWWFFVR